MVPAVVWRTGLTLITLGSYLGVLAASLAVAPWSVQAFKVEPNELELETPYLRHNIEFTRRAFGIDAVEERTYDAGALDDPAVIERNRDVLENVRLWDWRIILQTFRQLQQIRTYYDFKNVDVDRYTIDGAVR